MFFQCFVAAEGRKVGSLKRRVRSHVGGMSDQKLHAVVARSSFRSQKAKNIKSTLFWDYFWKLRCAKIARRCGAKHTSKSKRTKHTSSGALLQLEMLKKMWLWREARVEVNLRASLEGASMQRGRTRNRANSLGRAPLGVGRQRGRTGNRGNSLGTAPLGSDTKTQSFSGQI